MRMIYLDASAWVKAYVDEVGTEAITRLFAARESIASSTLGHVEVAATLARRGRGSGRRPEDLQPVPEALDQDWSDRMYRLSLSDSTCARARALAFDQGLRGADAVHLAAALTLRDQIAEAGVQLTLVASDKESLHAAGRLGLDSWDPTQDAEPPTR